MKKYILSILALAAAVSVGCNKEQAVPETGGRTVTVTAALEQGATKVTTGSETGKFAWEKGDQIGVWVGDAFVPFTLEDSSVGAVAGKFTGVVPEGKDIDFAVYPYSENDSYEDGVYTSNYSTGWYGGYKSCVHLYAPKSDAANEYKFQHLCAYAMVTLKNVRPDCKYIYLETTGGDLFLTGGQGADLTAEYPKFTTGAQAQGFIQLPEDHSKIVVYAPIIPGEWDNKYFIVKFFQDLGWDYEYGKGILPDEPVLNKAGYLQTGGFINRGDLIVLPAIEFEGGTASGLGATIEGGLSWLSGAKIGLYDGSAFSEMSLVGGNVAEGEFEGEIPAGATVAVSPASGMSLSGNTLRIEKATWGYTLGPVLYGPVGEGTASYEKTVAFKHLGAVVRATLNNVPESVTHLFVETGASSKFFFNAATCDLSADVPVLTAEAVNDWVFAAVPPHGDGARLVIDVPVAPGTYDDASPMFNIELYTEMDWGGKIDGTKQNKRLEETGGVIKRGDVIELEYNW